MDPLTAGWVGLAAIGVLVVIGVRVAYAAAAVGVIGLILMRGWNVGIGVSGVVPHAESVHYTLSVLPMFILIGYLAFYAGITKGLFDAAKAWLSHIPGGLGVGTVFSCAGFAAVSGASTASAAVFARIAIPEMLAAGYDRRLAAASVAVAGTLASLIPPSAILVIYGIIVEQSVGRLLIAGFIPGLITAAVYAGVIFFRVWLNPSLAPPVENRTTLRERVVALKGTTGVILVIGIVMGGIYLGWMTPTETGAVGAMIILFMAMQKREMTWTNFRDALSETAKLTVMIFTIIYSILIFVRFLGFSGLPESFAAWVVGLDVPRVVIFIAILAVYFVLGMFLDGIGMLMLTLPVVYPAIVKLGYDPIWFGIIIVKLVEICLVTPPVGLNCYVVNGVRPDIPLQDIFRGVWPFVVADLGVIALFYVFPEIVTFLPNAMFGKG
ncbi:MAG TPA: TRAP transporter large permease [Burkholderiales bacterium]